MFNADTFFSRMVFNLVEGGVITTCDYDKESGLSLTFVHEEIAQDFNNNVYDIALVKGKLNNGRTLTYSREGLSIIETIGNIYEERIKEMTIK